MAVPTTPGKRLADDFLASLRAAARGAPAAEPAVIYGVSGDGTLAEGLTLGECVGRIGRVLAESKRIYRISESTYLEVPGQGTARLDLVAAGPTLERGAHGLLANLIAAGMYRKDGETHGLMPDRLVAAALANDAVRARLPEVRDYARRPVFDADFNFVGPGWHPEKGILVHSREIAPALPPEAGEAPKASSPLDRLGPHLRATLGGYCWAGHADLVNGLAFLLTGVLANRFVEHPHPIGLMDGNQPGVGKTLFFEVLGQLLDGRKPPKISVARDEELAKQLGAHLRDGQASVLLFDNLRGPLDSPLVEANALSPALSFRLLGHSRMISRPNAYLWCVTSNGLQATPDLISRSLPMRLRYEGDPRRREFPVDLVEYAREHREGVLGELYSLVQHWTGAGRPPGRQRHRCCRWAEVVGGVLDAAGLGEHFLANITEAEAAMDEGLLKLAALAEYVLESGLADLHARRGGPAAAGRVAKEWAYALQQSGALAAGPDRGGTNSAASRAGGFLAGKVDRTVRITTGEGTARATLRKREGRSRQTYYWLEVEDEEEPGASQGSAPADLPGPAPATRGRTTPAPDAPPASGLAAGYVDGTLEARGGEPAVAEVVAGHAGPAAGNSLDWS
jgi:hypothetical protein